MDTMLLLPSASQEVEVLAKAERRRFTKESLCANMSETLAL